MPRDGACRPGVSVRVRSTDVAGRITPPRPSWSTGARELRPRPGPVARMPRQVVRAAVANAWAKTAGETPRSFQPRVRAAEAAVPHLQRNIPARHCRQYQPGGNIESVELRIEAQRSAAVASRSLHAFQT